MTCLLLAQDTQVKIVCVSDLLVIIVQSFITGDFNLFANRQFSTDTGGTFIGGVVVEVLEDAIRGMNQQLEHPISYNISSSTPPQDVFDYVAHGEANVNLDCMLLLDLEHSIVLAGPRKLFVRLDDWQ